MVGPARRRGHQLLIKIEGVAWWVWPRVWGLPIVPSADVTGNVKPMECDQ